MNNPEVNPKFCFLRPLLQRGSLIVEQSRLIISFGASLVLSYSSQIQDKIDYTIITSNSLLKKRTNCNWLVDFRQFQGTQSYQVAV